MTKLAKRRAHFDPLASPSKIVLRFRKQLCSRPELPILDAGAGHGRNALPLAQQGCWVICADTDADRIEWLAQVERRLLRRAPGVGRIQPIRAHLGRDYWPFRNACFCAIICIHLVALDLIVRFESSLVAGGYLLFETFGGQGGNYVDLPKQGEVLRRLTDTFDLLFYRERLVGPPQFGAVTVSLLGRKKA